MRIASATSRAPKTTKDAAAASFVVFGALLVAESIRALA